MLSTSNDVCLTQTRFIDFTGIPFETEAQLRNRGTSRTPDILLSAPLGIEVPSKNGSKTEWKVICWIDSKVCTVVDFQATCSNRAPLRSY
jgi:hypothetical protein